ncbi:hypothetical protein H257_13893 [Aphanomyces astaci]|uniref:Uncharacterized protein n=1 Tax=Aphanomyces astaci TaxID=112090 RepID=W4FUL0_APHAT|nr:hypothetical protein H257_13893 [Aphanomyces astaci]ETV70499.1 hypothetical protein H257_13893 [Aphanomyces astaci]|eukprot:XP_009839882.1 hypothetical protein H257_13893 [Aphanomyces astaci]
MEGYVLANQNAPNCQPITHRFVLLFRLAQGKKFILKCVYHTLNMLKSHSKIRIIHPCRQNYGFKKSEWGTVVHSSTKYQSPKHESSVQIKYSRLNNIQVLVLG